MTFPRRYPVRYSEEEDALHAKIIVGTTKGAILSTRSTYRVLSSGLSRCVLTVRRGVGKMFIASSMCSCIEVLRAGFHTLMVLCHSTANRGQTTSMRVLQGVSSGAILVQRHILKTLTTIFNTSAYPLTYTWPYISAGIGSSASVARGLIVKITTRNIRADIEGGSTDSKRVQIYKTPIVSGTTSIRRSIWRDVVAAVSGVIACIRNTFWRPEPIYIEVDEPLYVIEVDIVDEVA